MKSPKDPQHNKKLGAIGEEAVANHLKRKGFKLLERNYLRKWGEIDIIVERDGIVHFVEVKSVSCEISTQGGVLVARGTGYKPEDNVHPWKLRKLHRAVQSWLAEENYESEWQIDVASVYLDQKNKKAVVKIIDNIILE